jgi:hypothetical protein
MALLAPPCGKSGLALLSALLIGQAAKYLIGSCSDGVWRPRVGKSGLALPSARLVSINIVPDVDAPSELGT